MGTQTDGVTEKLLLRAESAVALLQAHLEATGSPVYSGRITAARCILTQTVKDFRAHQAHVKLARRRRRAVRNPTSGAVHERM